MTYLFLKLSMKFISNTFREITIVVILALSYKLPAVLNNSFPRSSKIVNPLKTKEQNAYRVLSHINFCSISLKERKEN